MQPVPEIRSLLNELTPYEVENGEPVRIGPKGDGGYVILDHDSLKESALYAYGIDDNDHFDQHFRQTKPDSFATWAKRSSSSQAGIVCSVNSLRPCCGSMAMR